MTKITALNITEKNAVKKIFIYVIKLSKSLKVCSR